MKLGTRLGLAFTTLILLTFAIAGIGLWRLASVNAAAQEISGSWLPSVRVLGEIRATANQIRRAEADHLMAGNPGEAADIESRVAELRSKMVETMKAYEPLITSPQERAAYEDFGKRRAAWIGTRDRLFALSRSGSADAARELFRGTSRSEFNAMLAEIAKLVDTTTRARGSRRRCRRTPTHRPGCCWLA